MGKEALGCKFAKHEPKDDDEDMDETERKERDEQKAKILNQNLRCYACKEIGHRSRDCPHDPNMRTAYPVFKVQNFNKLKFNKHKLSKWNKSQIYQNYKMSPGTKLFIFGFAPIFDHCFDFGLQFCSKFCK